VRGAARAPKGWDVDAADRALSLLSAILIELDPNENDDGPTGRNPRLIAPIESAWEKINAIQRSARAVAS
jgi:hypothetical protein